MSDRMNDMTKIDITRSNSLTDLAHRIRKIHRNYALHNRRGIGHMSAD
jgi:hypothetical protein